MFKNPSPTSPNITKHAQTTHAGLTSRWVKAWFPVACCPTFAVPTSTESTDFTRHRHEAGQVTVIFLVQPVVNQLDGS
jgi:hypothetical protein